MTELRDTYLTQRLARPRPGAAEINRIFGGLHSLNEEGWDIIHQICRLEYMGAAEYEFNTLSDSLTVIHTLAKADALTSFCFTLNPGERELNPSRLWSKGKVPPAKSVLVFGICPKEHADAYVSRTRTLCSRPNEFWIKQGSKAAYALDPISEYEAETVGWIEETNNFLFFSDEKMWKDFCSLFNVEPCPVPELSETPDYSAMKKPELVSVAVNLGMFRSKNAAAKLKKSELLSQILGTQAEAETNEDNSLRAG